MATITVDELFTALGYEVDLTGLDQYTKKTDQAEKTTKRFGVSFEDVRKGVNNAAKAVGAAALGIGAAMIAIAVDTAKAGDEIAKMARATATAPVELQRLKKTAEISGVEFRKLQKALIFQNKLMGESVGKTTPFTEALGQLGLEMDDLAGLETEERLGLLADALNGVADDASRAALQGRLFGEKIGPELASFVALGSEGIKKIGDEAERTGEIMGGDLLDSAESFNDAGTRLKGVLTGLENAIASELLPVGEELIVFFQDFIQENDELIKRDLVDLIKGFAAVVRVALPFLVDMGGHIRTIVDTVTELDDKFGIAEKATFALTTAFKVMFFPITSTVFVIQKAVDLVTALASKIPGLSNAVTAFRNAVGLGDDPEPQLVGTTEEIRAKGGAQIEAAGRAKGENAARTRQNIARDTSLAAVVTSASSVDELKRVVRGQASAALKVRAAVLLPQAASREQTQREVAEQTLRLGRATAQRVRASAIVGSVTSDEDKKKGGRGGGKKKGGPGDFLSDLLGETGGGGGRISAGGGTAPLAGAGFQTINAQFLGRTEVNVTVPGGARVSADDVAEVVVEALERRDREIFDHYQKVAGIA